MATTDKERGPCDNCRERHIKCSRGAPCDSCAKHNHRCTRARAFRFKRSTRFKSNLSFSADQPWVDSKADRLSYVDMTKNVTRKHATRAIGHSHNDTATDVSAQFSQLQQGSVLQNGSTIDTGISSFDRSTASRTASSFPAAHRPLSLEKNLESEHGMTYGSTNAGDNSFNVLSPNTTSATIVSTAPTTWRSTRTHAITSPHASHDAARASWRHPSRDFPSPLAMHGSNNTSPMAASTNRSNQSAALSGVPETTNDHSYLGLQEACLIRHFVEKLGPWFDTCDRDQHYKVVVPQRAMFCPVLLYALYTASARHLTRMPGMRNIHGVVECYGISLPDLKDDTAIHYHNTCINHLIEISNDPAQSYNEDALTAATVLRWYEQIDTPLMGCDSQTYLTVIRTVIDTQKDPSFYAVWKIEGPPRDNDLYASPACSLRHSACIVALQQEVWSILLTQRPCRLPLCPNNNYSASSLTPADDFVWANRILVWFADVLKFCFGDENSNTVNISVKTRIEHWEALKQFEDSWTLLQPPSFKASYFAPPDPENARFFPEYWNMTVCQTYALQNIEMGKILLAVHSPKLPRLGLGAESAQRGVRALMRDACLKIVGLGCSRREWPSAMVTAAVGVSICGECLTDPGEQEAVVKFMRGLEIEHAWPTGAVVDALREAWAGG